MNNLDSNLVKLISCFQKKLNAVCNEPALWDTENIIDVFPADVGIPDTLSETFDNRE